MQIKKSPKASLEDKKFTYVLIGFVFILSACFVALEWTDKLKVHEVVNEDASFEQEIEIQQTAEQKTPPPPPPEEVPKDMEEIIVKDDDVEVAENNFTSEDDGKEIQIAPPVAVEEEPEEDQTIFVVVENNPEFPGGEAALFKYLNENIKYPVIAQENGIQGRVTCQFVINSDGSIVDIVVARSSGDASLDKEAVRVIKNMPKWKPGRQRNKPVRVRFTLPVNFRLQ